MRECNFFAFIEYQFLPNGGKLLFDELKREKTTIRIRFSDPLKRMCSGAESTAKIKNFPEWSAVRARG